MELCPCGSGKAFNECCEPLIQGVQDAQTAEALMRSRYSAYATKQIDYVERTTHSSQLKNFKQDEGTDWAKNFEWTGLEIISTEAGGPEDESGMVEFVARYRNKDKAYEHHEIAEFGKEDGRWYFKDGQAPRPEQYVRQGPKVGRNDPCPCGSGKKYKKCCG